MKLQKEIPTDVWPLIVSFMPEWWLADKNIIKKFLPISVDKNNLSPYDLFTAIDAYKKVLLGKNCDLKSLLILRQVSNSFNDLITTRFSKASIPAFWLTQFALETQENLELLEQLPDFQLNFIVLPQIATMRPKPHRNLFWLSLALACNILPGIICCIGIAGLILSQDKSNQMIAGLLTAISMMICLIACAITYCWSNRAYPTPMVDQNKLVVILQNTFPDQRFFKQLAKLNFNANPDQLLVELETEISHVLATLNFTEEKIKLFSPMILESIMTYLKVSNKSTLEIERERRPLLGNNRETLYYTANNFNSSEETIVEIRLDDTLSKKL